MGTFPPVRAVGLGVALAVALWAALRWFLARRRAVPGGVGLLAEAVPEALGDAVLALDGAGRIGHANSAAARLVGIPVPELVDRDVSEVIPELAALARGAGRGPAAARLAVPAPRGSLRVRAVVVRVCARPPWDLAVLRPLPVTRPRPPPLPRPPPAPWPARGEARAGFAAAAIALREPLARAAGALSILRLAAPALGARGDAALAEAEAALEVAGHRVAALAAAGAGGARRALDLGALAADLVARFPAPADVTIRLGAAAGDARALGDDRPVRAALRELLSAAAPAAAGGELVVAVRAGPGSVAIEVRSPARVPAGGLSLARALVAPQGGRVEEEPEPGRGGVVVRIALERAASLEPA